MKIIRILGGYKKTRCFECGKNIIKYWTYKDTLMICKFCEQLFVITSQDKVYGDFNSAIQGKNCPNCNCLLKDSLVAYKLLENTCTICNSKEETIESKKDIYIDAYDVFS